MKEETKKQTTHSWGKNQADKNIHKYTFKKLIAYKEQQRACCYESHGLPCDGRNSCFYLYAACCLIFYFFLLYTQETHTFKTKIVAITFHM